MEVGVLTASSQTVIAGVIGLVILAGIVLSVITQINNLRAKGIAEKAAAKAEAENAMQKIKVEAAAAIEAAKIEAAKETESKLAFIALKDSVDAMNRTVGNLSKGVGDQILSLQKEQENICRRVDRVADSTRSAHKRIDEHRKVDHSFPNGHYIEPDEDPEPRL